MQTKKRLSQSALGSALFVCAFACSGGVQTTCGELDADGGIIACGGSTGAGGEAGQGTINFAGATSVAGSPSTGGTVGCASTEPTGYLPSVEYCSPTTDLGDISCASWMNIDPLNPNDPRREIPDWGYYQLNNPTMSPRSDIQLKIGVAPFRLDGATVYSFFDTVYLYFEGLPESQPFVALPLSDFIQENETDAFGITWVHIYDSTIPSIVVSADSTRSFRLAATLCPMFPSGGTQRAIPATGTKLELFVEGFLYNDQLTGTTYVPLPRVQRTFGQANP